MHKVILVYGPTKLYELQMVMDSKVGEGVYRSKMLDVLALHGMPVSVGPWNLVFETIKAQIATYNDHPSFAVIHESQVGGEFDISLTEFDAVFSYALDPETGYRLAKLHRPFCEIVGDWWVIGGRWSNMLIAKDPALKDVIDDDDDVQVIVENFNRIFGKTPESVEEGPALGRNSLSFGDIDWEAMKAKKFDHIDIEGVLRISEKYNLKCVELIFEERFGAQMRDLEECYQAHFRLEKRREVWDLFWQQLTNEEMAAVPEDRKIAALHNSHLGYPREQLERWCEVAHYLRGGVIVDGDYFDAEPDPCAVVPILLEDLIRIGERLRDLPDTTIVTVVDLHY